MMQPQAQPQQPNAFQRGLNGLFGPQMMPVWAGLALGGTRQQQAHLATQGLNNANLLNQRDAQLAQQQQQFDERQALARQQLGALENYRNRSLGLQRERLDAQNANPIITQIQHVREALEGGHIDNRVADQMIGALVEGEDSAPLTQLGKLGADLNAGRISQEQYDAGVAKATRTGPNMTVQVPSGYTPDFDESGQITGVRPIPGGPATQLPAEVAGRAAAASVARRSLEEAEKFYLTPGSYDMGDRARDIGIGDFRPIAGGESGRARRAVMLGVEAALRLMTGAAAPAAEVQRYTDIFAPGPTDTKETRQQKLKMLRDFISQAESNALRGRGERSEPAKSDTTPSMDNLRQKYGLE